MRLRKSAFAIAALAAASATNAAAHPGANLLITGGKAPRAAMSGGVSFESQDGIHIYRGARRIAGAHAPSLKPRSGAKIEIKIIQRGQPWRRLCTQGFYSGDCTGARRSYNQGFWSGH